MKPLITLTSDWKTRDPYVGMLKGQLLYAVPEANIIDITHAIDFSNLNQTAFILQHCYDHFPKGTIHLILTNYSAISPIVPVVIEHDGHYFVGEDNGVFCMMFGQREPVEGRRFEKPGFEGNPIDMLIELVKALVNNEVEAITQPVPEVKRAFCLQAAFACKDVVEGQIVYIDGYYNAVTNIPVEMFRETIQDRPFEAVIKSNNDWTIRAFHEQYCDDAEFYFVPNAMGCLEIAMYRGNAAILADLQVNDKVIITCK